MEFPESALEVFVIEAKGLLSKMEDILLKMEQGEQSDDFVNSIFRSAHTLKGSAAMFNFTHLSEFAHQIENLLSIFREKKFSVTKEKIAVLLESIDCLRNLLQDSLTGKVSAKSLAQKLDLTNKLSKSQETSDQEQHNQAQNNQEQSNQEQSNQESNSKKTIDQNQKEVDCKDKEKKHASLQHVKTSTKETNYLFQDNFMKVGFNKLDEIVNLMGELFVAQSCLKNFIEEYKIGNENLSNIIQHIAKLIDDLKTISLQLRMLPIKEVFSMFSRVVRDLSVREKKQIQLEIIGGETELDKFIVEKINEPLLHLIRNACEHGVDLPADRLSLGKPACGRITLTAKQENNEAIVIIQDDGRGIDLTKVKAKAINLGLLDESINLTKEQLISFIFYPGVSTAEKVTDLSGRGVGMDIVKKEVEKLHGTVKVESIENKGTNVVIRLPLTLAIINGLLFKLNDLFFIVPMWNVVECINISPEEYQSVLQNNYFCFRNKIMPGVVLTNVFNMSPKNFSNIAIIVRHADNEVAVIVTSLQGEIQTIIKPVPHFFYGVLWAAGTAVLGNGEIAIIVDVPKLINYLADQNNFGKVNYAR